MCKQPCQVPSAWPMRLVSTAPVKTMSVTTKAQNQARQINQLLIKVILCRQHHRVFACLTDRCTAELAVQLLRAGILGAGPGSCTVMGDMLPSNGFASQ